MANDYVIAGELASFLQVPESATITKIADLTNMLINEEWADPETPTPARVLGIAWAVAVRAGANPKGLSSWTRSWDDLSRTERMEAGREFGVYLTDDEKARLNPATSSSPRRVKSIQVRVPGWR